MSVKRHFTVLKNSYLPILYYSHAEGELEMDILSLNDREEVSGMREIVGNLLEIRDPGDVYNAFL